MGQAESCFPVEGQNPRRRNKRHHGEDQPVPVPLVGFAPARHGLTDAGGGTSARPKPSAPRSGQPSSSACLVRPRKAIRRLFGRQSDSQPMTSNAADQIDCFQLEPIDLNLQPLMTTGGGFSQNQDEEMVDASALSMSQGSQSGKRIKLQMEIDSGDGSISGRVLVEAQDRGGAYNNIGADSVLMNIPSQICSICQEQVKNIGLGQEDSQQSSSGQFFQQASQLHTLEEMRRAFDRNESQYLYALERDLMKGIGHINLDDIVGFIQERKSIEEEILNRRSRPDLFDGLRKFTATGVLISGHEGNGKTTLARIIASYITFRFINVQPYYFDADNKYERMIGIFRLARATQPAVIIFEAADQLNPGTNQMFGQNKKLQHLFMSEFRNSVQSGDQIVVIITMNSCSHYLPKTILSCFEHKIHLSLPSDTERKALLKLFMRGTNHQLKQLDFHQIADLTRGFPRGQIQTLCRMASNVPAMEMSAIMAEGYSPQNIRAVTGNDFILAINKLLKMDSDSQDSQSGRTSVSSVATVSMSQDEQDPTVSGNMSDVD